MKTPRLDVRRLTVHAGRKVVVRDVSLEARPGTLVWITGENGVGKSSLLKVLALRARASGSVSFDPAPSHERIAYYSPAMGLPPHANVRTWLHFNRRLPDSANALLTDDDPLLPVVNEKARLTRLSTGEGKRLLLWSLLRTARPFTLLDEPYEHLSLTAKKRLTRILLERVRSGVVVVATNQEVPESPYGQVLNIEAV